MVLGLLRHSLSEYTHSVYLLKREVDVRNPIQPSRAIIRFSNGKHGCFRHSTYTLSLTTIHPFTKTDPSHY